MVNVKGRWALITGASRGIGKLVANFMAEQGCNLVLHSRSLESSQIVESELSNTGVKLVSVAAELDSREQIQAMLKSLDQQGIAIDILFNNAAIQVGYREKYFETPLNDFDASFQVNLVAPAMLMNHFMPKMMERGFGRIINTTSGIRDQPEQAGYSASKAALDKLTKDLGTKVEGTDVLINLTDPGWCRTDLGGDQAPNDPLTSIPGVVVGSFVDDKKSGRFFGADTFHGMNLEEAVQKAESIERLD